MIVGYYSYQKTIKLSTMLRQVFGGKQGEWHRKSGKLQKEDPLLWQAYHSTEPKLPCTLVGENKVFSYSAVVNDL